MIRRGIPYEVRWQFWSAFAATRERSAGDVPTNAVSTDEPPRPEVPLKLAAGGVPRPLQYLSGEEGDEGDEVEDDGDVAATCSVFRRRKCDSPLPRSLLELPPPSEENITGDSSRRILPFFFSCFSTVGAIYRGHWTATPNLIPTSFFNAFLQPIEQQLLLIE